MVFAVIALTAGAACPKPGPAEPVASSTADAAAWDKPVPPTLDGTWSDGTTTLKLDPMGGYWWQQPRACKAPPCPLVATTGTYQDGGDHLVLDPDDETDDDQVLQYRFADSELELSRARDRRTWTLNKQQ